MAIVSELPKDAQVLDLGAARVARAEARTTKSFIKLAAGYVETVAEIPVAAAFLVEQGDIVGALSAFLADPADLDALVKDGLTTSDVEEITAFIAGKTVGELQASLKS